MRFDVSVGGFFVDMDLSLMMRLCLEMLRPLLIVVLAATLPVGAHAGAGALDRAEQLILQNNVGPALVILNAYRPENGAETERRLWALVVAMGRQNRPRAALPYLERLVSIAPNSAKYRLELAAILAAVGQDDRARYQYGLLRTAANTPDRADMIDANLAALDRRKSWEANFSVALTPESNPGLRTDARTILIGGLPFGVSSAARARPANGVRLGFGGALLPWVAPNTRARLGLSFDGRFFDPSSNVPNDTSVTLEAGLLHFGDMGRLTSATFSTTQRRLDGKSYSTTTGLTLHFGTNLGLAGSLSLGARFQKIDYAAPGFASVTETRLSARYSHNLSPSLRLYAGAFGERRNSVNTLEAGKSFGLSVGGQYQFQGGLMLGLDVEQSHLSRDGRSTLFAANRQENKTTVTLRAMNRNWTSFGFTPVLELGFEKNRANIPIYSFENRRVSIAFTRYF